MFGSLRRLSAMLFLGTSCFAQSDEDNYILAAGDEVAVRVFGQNDLETVQEISNRGAINMGLIGPVEIARITIGEAEDKIRQALIDGQYLRNPQVIIGVRKYSAKLVSVLGQVNRPGSVQLNATASSMHSMPLARVISMVGGFRGIARKDRVRVVRSLPSGEEETIIVDMSDIGKNRRDENEDIGFVVLANDVIYVPERIF